MSLGICVPSRQHVNCDIRDSHFELSRYLEKGPLNSVHCPVVYERE